VTRPGVILIRWRRLLKIIEKYSKSELRDQICPPRLSYEPVNLPPGRVPGKIQQPTWPKSEAGDRGADLTGDNMAKGLTPKQAAFVQEYLCDLNATQAAIRAGYSATNAGKIGPELLGKTRIAESIAEQTKKRAEKTARTALHVLQDIQRVTQTAEAAGDLKTALKGLELEGRHVGMFNDKLALTGDIHILNVHRKAKPRPEEGES
jgi:phage terminase small subunit